MEDLGTRWLGREVISWLDVVESTNTEAIDMARNGAPEGAVVVADCQTRGRGRQGRLWVSPAGVGLYVSTVLRPKVPVESIPGLTLAAGVAAALAIEQFDVGARLKWPNDIMIAEKKVGGILTEAVWDKRGIDFVVVGVGINVNTQEDELPLSIERPATSLGLYLGREVSRTGLIRALLCQLERWYESFIQGESEAIHRAWKGLDMTAGREVEVCLPKTRIRGTAESIGPDGALLVRTDKGELHTILAGDVVQCRMVGDE